MNESKRKNVASAVVKMSCEIRVKKWKGEREAAIIRVLYNF